MNLRLSASVGLGLALLAAAAACVPAPAPPSPGRVAGVPAPPPPPAPTPGLIPDSDIARYTVAWPNAIPATPGSGDFRSRCQFSHMNYDDPIVYPGQVGAAHLHMYFGNTLANAHSNDVSLLATGNGTCHGGPLNRSAYWMPALFDANNLVRVPDYIDLYYKTGSGGFAPSDMRTLPQGMKMITGDMNAVSEQDATKVSWWCVRAATNKGSTIPVCPAGSDLQASMVFPTCWNGRDLDSADHRSHVAHGFYGPNGAFQCPASHPVKLPEITFRAYWTNPDTTTAGWYVASDRHHGASKPGGLTLHADWWGAWQPTVFETFVQRCLRAALSCQDGELGNGRRMLTPPPYAGPRAVAPPAHP